MDSTVAGSMPSVSVGYEVGDSEADGVKDTSTFVGLQWMKLALVHSELLGTTGHITDGDPEYYMYEAFYS